MMNPFDILKRGVNMIRPNRVQAATAMPKGTIPGEVGGANVARQAAMNNVTRATPGGRVFQSHADDIKRALNGDF